MTSKAQQWLAKYYPVQADQCPEKDAIAHSLKKWRGLRPKVLKKYGLHVSRGNLWDEDDDLLLMVDGRTCALCHWHTPVDPSEECRKCPINGACSSIGPWGDWIANDDPEPMIQALEKAAKDTT